MEALRGNARTWYGAIFLCLLGAGLCAADLPGLRAPLVTTPGTLSQFRSRLPGTSTTGPTVNDTEIQELARGLKYKPGLMAKFVHDHIQFTPMWGEVKGPYMTWLDRSGGPWDQASLLIALLTHANGQGYTITNIKYVVGEIRLTRSQFCSWFSPSDPNGTIVRKMLARGGFYGEVTEDGYGEITQVKLIHVWVKATINGVDYEMDPSFKSHTQYGSSYWGGAISWHQWSNLIPHAEPSPGVWDTAALRSDLNAFTASLMSYIETNHPSDDLREVIGGKSIDTDYEATEPSLPSSYVPYTRYQQDQEFAIGSIPHIYRTKLRVQHQGIDQTLYSSDIYGRRLSLKYNGSNQPQLLLDGTLKATGNATSPGTAYDLTLTVEHPYQTTSFNGAVTLKVRAGGFYHIVNGWGDTGTKILLKHRGLLEQYRLTLADSSEEVRGESYAIVGLTYLAKISFLREMASRMGTNWIVVNHHLLGVAGQYDAPYLDIPLGHLGLTAFVTGGTDGTTAPAFHAIAGHAAAYEEEVLRQIQDANAVSVPRLLEMAVQRQTYNNIFTADSSNWSSVQSNLVSWSQAERDQVTPYINAGYSVDLPQYGDLTVDNWTGMGFRAILSDETMLAAAYVVGNYKGATGCATGDLSPSTLLNNGFGAATDGDPEGAYTTGATDIAIGHGGMPFGLAFGRQYSSHRSGKEGPLGRGWTHNYDITAKVTSDSFQVLAGPSALSSAATIISLGVMNWLLPAHQTTANLCQTWLIDQMKNNVVEIRQGSALLRFTKSPNGLYTPPPGQALKLSKVSGNFRLKNSKGIFYDFDSSGRLDEWSDAHGNKVDFSYTSGKLSSVACKVGGGTASWSLSFTYTGDRITSVTDSASRSISYQYNDNGELTRFRNPDANDVYYQYDATNKGRLRKIFSPVDVVNPFLTVVYDSLGRTKQQIDANDSTWDIYRATYRTEVLPPAQTDPNGLTKRFGSWTWVNPDNRRVTSRNAMGQRTTTIYDGQGRTETAIGPAGTSAEYWYDSNHNVLVAESLSIPGSGDPNVWAEYGYCTAVNEAGRWFVHRKEAIDVTGQKTLYYYDYNDVGTYGTKLGRLMKVVAPPAPAGRAVTQYVYNAYGQPETVTDPNGMVTKFEYYTAAQGGGLKKTIVDYGTGKLNLTSEITYDNVGRVATTKDPRGNITTNQYSTGGRLKKVTPPAPFNTSAYQTTYEYYADGKLKFVKQGSIVLQALTYNNRGQKATVRGPYPASYTPAEYAVNYTQYAYDALGRLWQVTDAEGNITTTRYYPDNKVWRVIDAEDHNSVTNRYYGDGSLKEVEDAKGNITQYEYNGFKALKKTIYPTPAAAPGQQFDSLAAYTKGGDAPWEADPSGFARSGSITHDQESWMSLEVSNGAGTVSFEWKVSSEANYDYLEFYLDDQLQDAISGSVDWTAKSYSIGSGTHQLKWRYVKDGSVSSGADRGYVRAVTWTPGGTPPVALYEERGYDEYRRLSWVRGRSGQRIEFEYDNLGRVAIKRVKNPNETVFNTITYQYDLLGRVYKTTDNYRTTKNTYDKAGRVVRVEYPDGKMVSYQYDAASNRTRLTYPDTSYITYEYDQLNRLKYVKNQGGSTLASYTYDSRSRRTDLDYLNGAYADYSYDAASRLLYVDNRANSGQDQHKYAYTYDKVGNRLSMDVTDGSGTRVHVYTYDKIYQITDVNYPDSLGYLATDTEFTYDAAGNRISVIDGGGTCNYTSNNLNQYTAAGGVSFSYDTSGNMTADGNYTYSYDPENRLLKVQKPNPPAQQLNSFAAYTKGGDAPWVADAGGFAQSGDIDDDQESWMYIDVTGPGTVAFSWKVSSESNWDFLEFWVDTTCRASISGEVGWEPKSFSVTGSGSHRLKWRYVKDSSASSGDDCGWVKNVTFTPPAGPAPDALAAAVDSGLAYTTGGTGGGWQVSTSDASYGGSCAVARPGYPEQESYLQTTVSGAGTIKFYWRSWGEPYVDYLKFYVDDTWRAEITGWMEEWTEATYTISGTGTHTLKWLYTKSSEENCEGYVDWVRWSGSVPAEPAPDAWSTLNYVYDAQGRRIEKKYDGRTVLRYVYDGDHCIAEYDAGNNLKRKYIYGPGVDQPICMIEAAGSYAGTYYYHFDALGSVVALTNSSGNTVQVYEYDAYGRVGATDANHPNRIMFTGREFDKETGLYYYRARYYNPQIGRFLQTDPIGYGDGMNLYRYCGNNPIGHVDPSGRIMISSPFIASSSLMGRLWEIIKETYKTVFNPNPAPDGGEAVLVGGTSVVTYATVLEGIEENGLDYAGSEDYETLRGIPGRVATPHDPLDNACECDTCRRRREADNNGNNSNGPASSSDPQECPLHGADRCCVCGLCPCHCNYRWTGGWCTVLQKWPHEVNNREE